MSAEVVPAWESRSADAFTLERHLRVIHREGPAVTVMCMVCGEEITVVAARKGAPLKLAAAESDRYTLWLDAGHRVLVCGGAS